MEFGLGMGRLAKPGFGGAFWCGQWSLGSGVPRAVMFLELFKLGFLEFVTHSSFGDFESTLSPFMFKG
eukprot:CAMPEP_0197014406 /NCGR_PEP_ID=MMETSP1380-20130617/70178_1 /TAXON_ID=5936 /ORGANISM="Euplotes crassus, Strain CT5" /LENGTH=67 /DNA_ID=CAMNT_0042439427 /DNA_START=76 /DNA_END=279 /DNA_ORIENTATION=-